ncbi:MAG: AI-2E family transporter [Bacteroidales bacterium]|jgi:predicted PurR-regulated permease PerM|nr:AI-2E family transporter [Bacteroidales bacterium]
MKINIYLILRLFLIATVILLGWYFSDILLYLFFAFIFSLIGKPVARAIHSIHIYKYRISYNTGTVLTMLLFISIILLAIFVIVPMIAREMNAIATVNYDELTVNLGILVEQVQNFLHQNGMIEPHETLVGMITAEIKNIVSFAAFSNVVGGFLSATGSFLFALFCILFFTFFFIKDDFTLDSIASVVFGKQPIVNVSEVSDKINKLLSRYFIGLSIEVFSMILLLYIGLLLFGVKGALLFAVFGGILNIIPYLGPIIGVTACCLFGTVDCLSIHEYHSVLPTIFSIAGVFLGANLIDNLLLQPIIYSQSIKVHPVEVFIVVIMAGTLAGITGMIIAIPVYTIIRTIALELVKFMNAK